MDEALFQVDFGSTVHATRYEELENLFFFNPYQSRYAQQISQTIDVYGMPAIKRVDERLTLTLTKCDQCQTLFMFEKNMAQPQLLGVAIFLRSTADSLEIIHTAVGECEDYRVRFAVPLGVLLVNAVVQIARQIRGVMTVILPYAMGQLSVSKGTSSHVAEWSSRDTVFQ